MIITDNILITLGLLILVHRWQHIKYVTLHLFNPRHNQKEMGHSKKVSLMGVNKGYTQ
jgi:hypothetical protein